MASPATGTNSVSAANIFHVMLSSIRRAGIGACLSLAAVSPAPSAAQTPAPIVVNVDWNRVVTTSRTTITVQVVPNPPLRRGSAIHDNAWNSLRQLNASDVRLAFWYPYPRLGVAELQPPAGAQAFWDFSAIDPVVEDFFAAVSGHPAVLCLPTIPQWMFTDSSAVRSNAPPPLPSDPDATVWDYEQGAVLRDSTLKEIAGYYERVARWYMKGGFRDETGFRHTSPYHFRPAYWEVLNEPEYEHNFSPEDYTRIYDAVTARLRRVDRRLKFVGLSLAIPDRGEPFFRYFLDHSHHRPGVRLDAISYHFYALGKAGESPGQQAAAFFSQADHFLETVRGIEAIRLRLSPATETQINEAGCIDASDENSADPKWRMSGVGIPSSYWDLCGAVFAYLAVRLSELGIQVVGASQLLGYPTQYPSVSLLDWTTGLPNPRYRALRLLIENLSPGDKLAAGSLNTVQLYAQPFIKPGGRRVILLVNKTSNLLEVDIPHFLSPPDSPPPSKLVTANENAHGNPIHLSDPVRVGSSGTLALPAFAVQFIYF